MKRADLKKVIKPLVKECIHEVLIEEGLLSNVVSEVAQGLQGNVIAEVATQPTPQPAIQKNFDKQKINKLKDQKRRMLEAIGKDAYNGVDLFEGTTPAPAQQQEAPAGSVDLGNPGDSGVDISSLMGGASKIWQAMK
tara:strand:- start:52 stop:462 length:411 start_codon:yes stop_codon:yes gene_type:complete